MHQVTTSPNLHTHSPSAQYKGRQLMKLATVYEEVPLGNVTDVMWTEFGDSPNPFGVEWGRRPDMTSSGNDSG
jgi:hypothetical protein